MKDYQSLVSDIGYGWAGLDVNALSVTLKAASNAFGKLRKVVAFDAIAFSGSSGSSIAFHLAIQHKIPLIYVRKENESTHGRAIECQIGVGTIKKYLIVDDFVDTGSTVTRIIEKIKEHAKYRGAFPAKPVGVFLFDGCAKSDTKQFGKRKLAVYAAKDID